MVAGLRYAHQAGVIHRDFKPANTFITDDEQVKLLDFGLAKWHHPRNEDALTSVTQPGQIMGTIAYMSPEQVRGLALTPATDIFSLAVVLYEMLSGRRPFEGDTNSDIMSSILRDPPRPLPPDLSLPAGLVILIMTCLDKKPENRPSITKILAQLKQIAETAEGPIQKLTRALHRHRFGPSGKAKKTTYHLGVCLFDTGGADRLVHRALVIRLTPGKNLPAGQCIHGSR